MPTTTSLPNNFSSHLRRTRQRILNVDGWLTDREVEFLLLAAACPLAAGEVLEIGSFRGKSTIALASGAQLSDRSMISAVDPHPVSGPTMLDADGQPSAVALLEHNLEQAGVREGVEIYKMTSGELARTWQRPLRLLWIDGDHSYAGALADFNGFGPHVVDGGLIAFHDILTPFGCTQAFKECILENPHFGPVGFCGSIGWGRYRRDAGAAARYAANRSRLASRLNRICGYESPDQLRSWREKLEYKILRARIPHGRMGARQWVAAVA